MLEEIGNVKQKLAELAPVLNAFKSEAVQLKLLEIIFGQGRDSPSDKEPKPALHTPAKKRRKNKGRGAPPPSNAATAKSPAKRKANASGNGANATLNQLAQGDFFSKPRTINDIIQHCKDNLARTFKANEMSGKLGRMVRDNELSRAKNKDGQYEYKKA